MTCTTASEKAALRRAARQKAASLSPGARRQSDRALFARFLALPQVQAADVVLLYHGMGSEPESARLLPPLWAAGKTVGLPRCLPGHTLEFRAVQADSPLIRHPFGMLEPGEDCPRLEAADLALIPGLAFDRSGGRLGQGGGFYDRWLPGACAFTVGLCRDCLLWDRLPRESHDRLVDLVVTERGLYGPSAPNAVRGGTRRPRPAPDVT